MNYWKKMVVGIWSSILSFSTPMLYHLRYIGVTIYHLNVIDEQVNV